MIDTGLVHAIVALNALGQAVLIGRLHNPPRIKRVCQALALGVPVAVALAMRLGVAGGLIHARLADQSAAEHWVTSAASMLLLAAPWLVSVAAAVLACRPAARSRGGATSSP